VLVRQPRATPRIGYYDNDDYVGRKQRAIIYYCAPPFLMNPKYQMVPMSRLSPVNTEVLWTRRLELQNLMIELRTGREGARRSFEQLYGLSLELSYVNSLLSDRMINALAKQGNIGGKRVFISYSSKDQAMATALSMASVFGFRPCQCHPALNLDAGFKAGASLSPAKRKFIRLVSERRC